MIIDRDYWHKSQSGVIKYSNFHFLTQMEFLMPGNRGRWILHLLQAISAKPPARPLNVGLWAQIERVSSPRHHPQGTGPNCSARQFVDLWSTAHSSLHQVNLSLLLAETFEK